MFFPCAVINNEAAVAVEVEVVVVAVVVLVVVVGSDIILKFTICQIWTTCKAPKKNSWKHTLRIFPHLKFHHIFKFKTLPPSWTNKFSKKPGNSILRSHHLFTDFHPLPLAMAKYGKAGATIHWPPGGISKGPWKNTTCRVKSAKQLTVDSSPFPKKTKNIRNKKIKQVKTPTSECFGFFTASWWSKRVWFISWMYKDCFSFETTFQNIVATFCITYQSLLAQRWQPDFSIHHGCCRLKSLSYLLGLHGSRKNPRVLMKSL